MLRISQEALTFDDVLLLPGYSEVTAKDVSLATKLTRNISLNLPLVSAAMDTVTESGLAIALAQEGGIGIVHKNLTIAEQAEQVRKVKKFESGVVKDPITISHTATIADLIELTRANGISGVPVMQDGDLVGIVTRRDLRFETDTSQSVSAIMTPRDKLVTVKEGASSAEVQRLLHQHRIEKILVVDHAGALKGLITVKDFDKAESFPHACKDQFGQLRVGASVGTSADTDERVDALVNAGVDVLVVDTAHGHSLNVINRVRWIKENYPNVDVIGGNIATADAAVGVGAVLADLIRLVELGVGLFGEGAPEFIVTGNDVSCAVVSTVVGVDVASIQMGARCTIKGCHHPIHSDVIGFASRGELDTPGAITVVVKHVVDHVGFVIGRSGKSGQDITGANGALANVVTADSIFEQSAACSCVGAGVIAFNRGSICAEEVLADEQAHVGR